MRRYLLGLIALLIVLSLVMTGCAGQTDSSANTSEQSSKTVTGTTTTSDSGTQSSSTDQSSTVSEKTWVLRMHIEQAESSSQYIYAHEPWIQDIEKATNGRVKIDPYPMSTMMKTQDAPEGVKAGICDVAWIFLGYFPGQFDSLLYASLPFMMSSGKAGSKVSWNLYEKFPAIQEEFKDFKVLTTYTSEPKFLHTQKPVQTIEDLDGMKIRASGGPPTEMMKLLGGTPVMCAMPDTYVNLEKGVIDGTKSNGEVENAWRLYEVCDNYTMVPLNVATFAYIMNKDVWNEMPSDVQEAIMSVSGEYQAVRGGDSFDRCNSELAEMIATAGYQMNTYTFSKDQINQWKEVAGIPVWNSWAEGLEPKLGETAYEILDETIRLAEQFSNE